LSEKKIKTAVLVSGGGTNLRALLDSERRGELPHAEIALVVSNRQDAYALTRAADAGVEGIFISRKELGAEGFEKKLIKELEAHDIELIVLAGFLCILSENFTRKYEGRIINIHPSLIPSFCGQGMYGLKVHEAALAYGVKVTGATVHFVNEIPDGGQIIMQKAVPVCDGDSPEVLQKRVMEQAEWVILPMSLEKVAKDLAQNR